MLCGTTKNINIVLRILIDLLDPLALCIMKLGSAYGQSYNYDSYH
jgi:hypothetical protein